MEVIYKDEKVEVKLVVGETLEEAIELVGAEKVHEFYREAAEKAGVKLVKRYMAKGWDEARIAGAMAEWTPASVVKKIVDPVAKLNKMMEKLSPEELELFKAGL